MSAPLPATQVFYCLSNEFLPQDLCPALPSAWSPLLINTHPAYLPLIQVSRAIFLTASASISHHRSMGTGRVSPILPTPHPPALLHFSLLSTYCHLIVYNNYYCPYSSSRMQTPLRQGLCFSRYYGPRTKDNDSLIVGAHYIFAERINMFISVKVVNKLNYVFLHFNQSLAENTII